MPQLQRHEEIILWKCPICGVVAKIPWDTPAVRCSCGFSQHNGATPGLGDYIAATLHKIGITPARYTAAKAALGLKKRCGCHKRQQRLNELGRKIGIG